jgi:RimJ/RimL family protein N-acetyltransferase
MIVTKTERLILRRWRESDREPFARLNSDPRVMQFFPRTLSAEESNLLVDHSFVGFVGLAIPGFSSHFTPCVEIGWRLAAACWGRGLATEGAREIVRQAFEVHGLEELVSFTVPANVRSRRVMEKLGMTRSAADDFDHPKIPEGDPLRRHVLYRLRRP